MVRELEQALRSNDELGEGPWWSVREQKLWRVDILGQRVHSWDPVSGKSTQWSMGEDVGFAVPSEGGQFVAGTRSGVRLVNLATEDSTEILVLPGPGAGRFNDGKTDRFGRVWAGTIVDDQAERNGVFGRIDAAGFRTAVDGVGISNGLGWSPDGETMYLTDSAVQTIWAFDFDGRDATLSNRRVFATDDECAPDGLTVDAEGGVWSAKWDGHRVVRYEPDGSVSDVIRSPVARPTSCMFGGPDLETLYVTSASVGLDDAERSATPAGSVLAVVPGVKGLPEVEATSLST